jgi:hypothetical protein
MLALGVKPAACMRLGIGGRYQRCVPILSRILQPSRSLVTCATCGLHSVQALVVRDYLE